VTAAENLDPRVSFVTNPRKVLTPDGASPPYHIWYIDAFPLELLKYTPLEDVTGETPRRLMLAEDIEKRGLINPLIVWNHTPSGQRDSPRPYFLHLGYNKLWALKRLGKTHARAFLTLNMGRAPDFPCRGCPTSADLRDCYGDGTLVLGQEGPVFKGVASIDNWQLPALPSDSPFLSRVLKG